MAPTIEDIMLGLEARLETIPGLRTSEFTRDQVNPPFAIVGVPAIEAYHATMQRGKFTVTPTITVLTSAAYDRTGQLKLASYADPTGPSSVVVAIEGDKRLGGVVEDCHVVDFRPLGIQEAGLIGYYGGLFNVRCIASGV